MTFFWEMLAAVFFFLGISGLVYWLKTVCRLPLCLGEDILLKSTLYVTGRGENLQPAVETLLWLQRDSGQNAVVVLDIRNAEESAKRQAELLAKQYEEIALWE